MAIDDHSRPRPQSLAVSDIVHATVAIDDQTDILRARSAGREVARQQGFGTVDQTRLATAISELARNALHYGRRGRCIISVSTLADGRRTVLVVVEDDGPGIDDVVLALKPGFSSDRGLGQGLPAVRRLMDHLTIDSRPGRTRIEATMSRLP